MKVVRKEWSITINKPVQEVWDFFAQPANLEKVTPAHVNFQTIGDLKGKVIYPGMIVQHKISPLLGIPLNWTTEIKHVEPYKYFIDEQRYGPYAFWHHEHHFQKQGDSTFMTDILYYKVPLGFIGTIANALFVNKMVNEIFEFREETFNRVFA